MFKFIIWQSEKSGQWYWQLKAANGESLCVSEGYVSHASAVHAVNAVRKNAAAATIEGA